MNVEETLLRERAAVHAALGEPARLTIVDTLLVGDASPGELSAALGVPSNLLAHHLRILEEAGVIRRVRSEADRRRTYVQLIPATLATLVPSGVSRVPPAGRVVFVCTRNSARSQFAAALWARRSPIPAASAGTRPAERIHPRAIRVAARHDLNLKTARPRPVDDVIDRDDLIIAVCDNAHEHLTRPDQPTTRLPRLHWSVPDPAPHDSDEAFEAAFNQIADRIDRLATALPTDGDDHDRHTRN